jgi:hypothetical protein
VRVRSARLRRRGLVVALRASGVTLHSLRIVLLDGDRDLVATRRVRRLAGRRRVRLLLRRGLPPGTYRLSVRGLAPNGAALGASARVVVLRPG